MFSSAFSTFDFNKYLVLIWLEAYGIKSREFCPCRIRAIAYFRTKF